MMKIFKNLCFSFRLGHIAQQVQTAASTGVITNELADQLGAIIRNLTDKANTFLAGAGMYLPCLYWLLNSELYTQSIADQPDQPV